MRMRVRGCTDRQTDRQAECMNTFQFCRKMLKKFSQYQKKIMMSSYLGFRKLKESVPIKCENHRIKKSYCLLLLPDTYSLSPPQKNETRLFISVQIVVQK